MNEIFKVDYLDISQIQWGKSPAPLLPSSLISIWKDEELPHWVCEEIGLPNNSHFSDLQDKTWQKIDSLSNRLKNFAIFLLKSRSRTVKQLRCFTIPWPIGLKPSEITWSVRTRNCLAKNGLISDAQALAKLTFNELFKIDGMGVRSILEFVCTTEGAMNMTLKLSETDDEGSNQHLSIIEYLKSVQEQKWTEQISAADPRFKKFLNFGEGSISDRIDRALSGYTELKTAVEIPALVQSIRDIELTLPKYSKIPLDEALLQFLGLLTKAKNTRLIAIADRLGWSGKKPKTLEESAQKIGITRERMRQIQNEILKRLPEHPVFMPQLDKAIEILEKNAPLEHDEAALLLKNEGITKINFSPFSVIQAATAFDREFALGIRTSKDKTIVTSDISQKVFTLIPRIARKIAGRNGISNTYQVSDWLNENESIIIKEEKIKKLLSKFKSFEFLDEDWFWDTSIKNERNRLFNVSIRILSVTSPISVQDLRQGIRRYFGWRDKSGTYVDQLPLVVPPLEMMRIFYRKHPNFIIDGDLVSYIDPLNYKEILGEVDQIFVDAFRTSPSGLLDRKSLANICLKRGAKENTFNAFQTYSPILDHVDTDIWKLRGKKVDPAEIEAIRTANNLKPREKRVIDYGWNEQGEISVAVKVPKLTGSMVVGCPGALKRYLSGQTYHCRTRDTHAECGNIVVREDSSMYGFGVFTRKYGIDEGDILLVEFDTINKLAYLSIASHEYLDEAL